MTQSQPIEVLPDAVCIGCGYRLYGLPTQTCPECGRWFDPRDPTTFRVGSKTPDWRRWARPPSMTECVLIAAMTIYALVGASGPERWDAQGICFVSLVGAPLWLTIAIVASLRALACWYDRERPTRDYAARPHRSRFRWFVAPICVLLVLLTFVYPWQLKLRFGLSRSAFETALAEQRAGTFTGGRWVGLYHVKRAFPAPRKSAPAVVKFETGYSIFDPTGFEFDPSPNHVETFITVRVAPSWYTY